VNQKKTIAEFESLQAFFIRELKEGARNLEGGSHTIISPCDGFFGTSGVVKNDTCLQVKGKTYHLSALLGDQELAMLFDGGSYQTLYLAPQNYHRFHAPCDLKLIETAYLPGYLWPVNAKAVRNVDGLFCVNERIALFFETKLDRKVRIALVAVGATMVGKIRVKFDKTLTSNEKGALPKRRYFGSKGHSFERGQEIGHFEFGSTIIMVIDKAGGSFDSKAVSSEVRMGEKIGELAV